MAAKANTTSSSTVGTSESMSSVFSSCRILEADDFEEGFSVNGVSSVFQHRPMSIQQVGSDVRYYIVQCEEKQHQGHHICDTCYLCKKRIHKNEEIYMYRGELPFCSQECRREQIEMDSALKLLQHQTDQKNNQKPNLERVNQRKCLTEMDSCTESGTGYSGYDFIRYVISLVVG